MPDTAERPSSRPLAPRAAELKRLAEQREVARTGAQQLEQLQTRTSELEGLAARASSLATTLTQLDRMKSVSPIGRGDLPKVRTRVHSLRERLEREGMSALLKKRALEALDADDALREVEKRARTAWREYVLGGLSTGGLEAVLS